MNKNIFRKSEVISYVEDLINCGASNEEQEQLYIQYQWTGRLEKNDTYVQVLREMRSLWNEKF